MGGPILTIDHKAPTFITRSGLYEMELKAKSILNLLVFLLLDSDMQGWYVSSLVLDTLCKQAHGVCF